MGWTPGVQAPSPVGRTEYLVPPQGTWEIQAGGAAGGLPGGSLGFGETEVFRLCGRGVRESSCRLGTTLEAKPTTVISREGLHSGKGYIPGPTDFQGSKGLWAGKEGVLGREQGKALVLVKP